jgi:hypothetical protein
VPPINPTPAPEQQARTALALVQVDYPQWLKDAEKAVQSQWRSWAVHLRTTAQRVHAVLRLVLLGTLLWLGCTWEEGHPVHRLVDSRWRYVPGLFSGGGYPYRWSPQLSFHKAKKNTSDGDNRWRCTDQGCLEEGTALRQNSRYVCWASDQASARSLTWIAGGCLKSTGVSPLHRYQQWWLVSRALGRTLQYPLPWRRDSDETLCVLCHGPWPITAWGATHTATRGGRPIRAHAKLRIPADGAVGCGHHHSTGPVGVPKPAPLPRLLSHPHLQSVLKTVGLASDPSDPPCPHPCFDLLDYGAVVDGSVLATNIIIKALEDVKAQGGGSIYFPAGIILTGTSRWQYLRRAQSSSELRTCKPRNIRCNGLQQRALRLPASYATGP